MGTEQETATTTWRTDPIARRAGTLIAEERKRIAQGGTDHRTCRDGFVDYIDGVLQMAASGREVNQARCDALKNVLGRGIDMPEKNWQGIDPDRALDVMVATAEALRIKVEVSEADEETPLQRLARLTIAGMEGWAADEDGVHESAWPAYAEAHGALGLPAPDPEARNPPEAAQAVSKAIYKFSVWFGRSGNLDGVFCAEPSKVEAIIGRKLRFGEALGKHSDVRHTIGRKDIKLVSSDPAFVALFEQHDLATGINPVAYAAANDEEDAEVARG